MRTYKEAQRETLAFLRGKGWTVVDTNQGRPMKIPHATDPEGRLRLWFKPQAVHWTWRGNPRHQNPHNFAGARAITYDLDLRTMAPALFLNWLEGLTFE